MAKDGVDHAEGHDGDRAGQHEQGARDQAALGLVKQPADVDGELLRLRAWQQHAVVQRMQEPVLADPALFLDENAVHDCDLSGRAAERKRRHARPDTHGFRKRDAMASLGADSTRITRDGG